MPKVLVLYYSAYGHLETMAQAVAEGRISSQMATFLDQAGGLWMKGALSGKVGGAFASTATQHGGQETTLFSIITNLLHFGMVVVGLPYSFQGQMGAEEITGGSPYGATSIAGGDGSRQPTENELAGARHQGELIAKVAAKIFG
jgi:NAD(P)H dehydrogenase (quinone)